MKLFKRLMAGALSVAILATSVATAGALSLNVVGDVDEDGKQTVADIIMIKKVVMGNRVVQRVTDRTDVDGDGKTQVSDILKLKDHILSEYKPTSLPTDKIANNRIYFIENVGSGKVLTGTRDGDRVDQWAYTGAAAQQWQVVQHGDYYMIVSRFNNQVWNIRDGSWLNINDAENMDNPSDEQLFRFEVDASGRYIIRPKVNEGRLIQVERDSMDDNANLQVNTENGSATEKWALINVSKVPGASDPEEVLEDEFADTVFTTFMEHYYLESPYGGHTIKDKNHFWDWAEMIEMVIDAYENNPCEEYKVMVTECVDAFLNEFGTNWEFNDYNDDLMWMVIACARAYNATGKDKYKETAKKNFDIVYRRGYTDSMGGGLLWRSNGDTSKNACINAPAVIGATYLYEIYGDKNYLDKAIDLFDWTTETLVVNEGDRAGRVHDNINGGDPGGQDFTYNQGTYIGAATRLWEITGEQEYRDLAKRTAQYTAERKYRWGIINNEGNLNEYYNDGHGFKGIFMRWFGYYIESTGDTDYDEWLGRNLYYGWNNRNSKGLVSTLWNSKTAENWTGPFNYYNFVVLAQIAPYEHLREMADAQ